MVHGFSSHGTQNLIAVHMTKSISASLKEFEAALSAEHVSFEKLLEIFENLDVPADVTDRQLTSLLNIYYRILGIEGFEPKVTLAANMEEWQATSSQAQKNSSRR